MCQESRFNKEDRYVLCQSTRQICQKIIYCLFNIGMVCFPSQVQSFWYQMITSAKLLIKSSAFHDLHAFSHMRGIILLIASHFFQIKIIYRLFIYSIGEALTLLHCVQLFTFISI